MMDYAGRVDQADTYPKLLRLNARQHGGEIALREKDFGLWRVFTWNEYQTRVHDFALGMIELGLGKGEVIGIIGDNRPDWVAAEVASHAIGKREQLVDLLFVLDEHQFGFAVVEEIGRFLVQHVAIEAEA